MVKVNSALVLLTLSSSVALSLLVLFVYPTFSSPSSPLASYRPTDSSQVPSSSSFPFDSTAISSTDSSVSVNQADNDHHHDGMFNLFSHTIDATHATKTVPSVQQPTGQRERGESLLFLSVALDPLRTSSSIKDSQQMKSTSDVQGVLLVQTVEKAGSSNTTQPLNTSHPPLERLIHRQRNDHRVPLTSTIGIVYCCVSVVLVVFAGFASGLTVGLMSLDPVQLKVLEAEGTPEQKESVREVSAVIRRHHLLLVTLLLSNSIAMETLPLFLDRVVPAWLAVVISVTAILLFGEIIPQALCTGPNQLAIAQIAAPFVNLLIGLLYVISYPIAKLLDWLLGDADHHAYYARAHLKALIRMHERDRRIKEAAGSQKLLDSETALGADEVVVIQGALDLASKTLREILLPVEDVFMLDAQTELNRETFELILNSGHSRIPVYQGHRHNIKGLLLTKSLLSINPVVGMSESCGREEIRAGELLVSRRPIFASPDVNLYDVLNEFQKGHSHIAFVTNQADEYIKAFKAKVDVPSHCTLIGIATLEDVIEELIQEEIYDEFDATAVDKAAQETSGSPTLTPHYFNLPSLPNTGSSVFEGLSSCDLPEVVKELSKEFSPSSASCTPRSRLHSGSFSSPLVLASTPLLTTTTPVSLLAGVSPKQGTGTPTSPREMKKSSGRRCCPGNEPDVSTNINKSYQDASISPRHGVQLQGSSIHTDAKTDRWV